MATRAGLGPGSKYFLKALASSSRAPPLEKKKPCQNPPRLMATFCPKHGSSTKAVLPESENPAGRRRRDVPAILKPSNFIWGGGRFRPPADLPCGGGGGGGEGGFINQELPLKPIVTPVNIAIKPRVLDPKP